MLRLRHGARALQLASQGLCACRLHHAVRCTNSAVLQTGSSLASRRDLAYSSAVVASTSSTVAEVCEWAGRAVAERGAGLSDTDVDILQREKISGGSLFTLTDAELQSVGFTLGARKDLLAAVALLKDPQERANFPVLVSRLTAPRGVAQQFAAFDGGAVLAAAFAYYRNEDGFVDVENSSVVFGSVALLPFVNRVEQLCDAARALVQNVTLLRTTPQGDSRMSTLVFCSQLYGAGKTSFAERLAAGLNAAYGGKLWYSRSEGLTADVTTADAAIALVVIRAAEQGSVITPEDAGRLRLPGFCNLISVLSFVQARLVSNEKVPGAVSRLFLHLDEFDLSSIDMLEFQHLKRSTLLDCYDYVWRVLLLPILRQHNFHLIVTGRPPELALLGTRGGSSSPTLAHHAVLGTLDVPHIDDILRRLRVQRTPDGAFESAYSVLGLPCVPSGPAVDVGELRDPLSSALVGGLRRYTAGVPRFLCLALGHLLRMRIVGSLPPLSDLDVTSVDAIFYSTSALSVAMLTGASGTFVRAPLAALRLLLADGSTGTRAQLMQLLIDMHCQSRVPRVSAAGSAMILNADKFGAYTDRDAESGSDAIKVVMPGIFQDFFRSRYVTDMLEAEFPAYMQLVTAQAASAGSLGDELEDRFGAALHFHWMLSANRGDATGPLRDLFATSRRFDGLDVVFSSSVAVDFDSPMGKVGNAAKPGSAASKLLSADSAVPGNNVDGWIPHLFRVCRVDQERHVMWKPLPQSHSADRTSSIVVRRIDGQVTAAEPAPTQRALLGFALKNAVDGSVTLSVLEKEVRNFADTVYSLTPAQLDLYGPRIVLFVFAPAHVRKLWEALKTSNDALFPFEYNGKSYSGVPGAAGVRFDNLLFDVVVVPHGVADAFMVSPRSRHLIATSAVGTDDLARARRG